ncbi:MAG: methyltransferase domain-containing protein [archaeon]
MDEQKFENNTLENTYENKNFITRTYFKWKINKAIKLAKLRRADIILDYGCGGGWLEKTLKNYKIYGYDINPKKTFIKDYKTIKPDKIFLLDVLEHISLSDIQEILDNFKGLNEHFRLVVSIPTENFISRKMRKFVGKTEIPKEHITKYREILNILKRNFKLKKKINFFTVTHIFLFEK